jgi:8-oxo-dGTP pyrophosphatase MutT (NUDIX family)
VSLDGRSLRIAARPPTLRDGALTLLSALPSSALRDRYVEHLRVHEDGMFRECSPDHLTASMLVLSHDYSQVLLTLHGKAQQWFQFGGHCEASDVTLAGAATREALEESGLASIDVDPVPIHLDEHAVPFCAAGPETHHLDVRFLGVAPAHAAHAVSEESLDVRWWPVDALPTDEPSMVALVKAALLRVVVTGDVDVVAADPQV